MEQVVEAHGARIPTIGLGTYPMKGAACAQVVAYAIGVGYRHIDTAAMYGNEDGVGEGVRAAKVPREEIFVTTKVWPSEIPDGGLIRSVQRSLKQLRMDYVDLLLIHWPNRSLSVEETIEPLNAAKRQGLARHIGVSNFDAKLLNDVWRVTREPLVANQCEYHPLMLQRETIAACQRHGTVFVSYSPLGKGSLLRNATIAGIAKRLDRTSSQIVLRWHVQQGLAAVPKSANPERIKANLDVYDFALSDKDMQDLSALAR